MKSSLKLSMVIWLWSIAFQACDTKVPGPEIEVELLTASMENPLSTGLYQTARIEYQQGNAEKQSFEVPIENENLSFKAPFVISADPVKMQITLVGQNQTLHGAPPIFKVNEAEGLIRIVLGEPGTCKVLSGIEFEKPFEQAAAVETDDFALIAGGRNAGGDNSEADLIAGIQFIDLLQLSVGQLEGISETLGSTKMAHTHHGTETHRTIGISENFGAFDLTIGSNQVSFQSLQAHAGVSMGSTLLELENGDVVIAGGGTAQQPAIGFTWIGENAIQTKQLTSPRYQPSVIEVAGEVWVGFGEQEQVTFERIMKDENRGALLMIEGDLQHRASPMLQLNPWTAAVWILGGQNQEGQTITEIQSLQNCPQNCTVQAEEPWPNIPQNPFVLQNENQLFWIPSQSENQSQIFATSFSAGNFETQPLWTVVHPRAFPSAWMTSAGIFFVAGGRDETLSTRSDVEICFPQRLAYFE